jgi:predicted nucleic acid-binding Zn ribbon protein
MINLCYGLVMDKEDVANDLKLVQFHNKCMVCDYQIKNTDNYCSNCGNKLKKIQLEINTGMVMQAMVKTFGGKPPRPIILMSHGETIAIGQVLSVDDEVPVLTLPVQYNLELIGKAVESYIFGRRAMPSIKREMKLFAIGGQYVQTHNH